MSEGKKNRLLLVAGILGVCGLILWGVGLFAPIIPNGVNEDGTFNRWTSVFSRVTSMLVNGELIERAQLLNEGSMVGLQVFFWLWPFAAFISVLAAVALSITGWLKNDAKKTLIAGILYIISLSLPSAIMCFIGRKRLTNA